MNAGLLLFLAALPGGILSAATVKERKRRDKPLSGGGGRECL